MMTILFLIDEWSSAAGGIQTVNRELCLALGRYKKDLPKASLDVMCIAQRCTPVERADAAQSGVILLQAELAEPVSASDARVLRTLFHSVFPAYAFRVACVVGHSKFTGLAARTVRAEHFPAAKLVTVYHMDVDETEGLKDKPDTDWEARFKLEIDIAKSADIVFAIGPRLERLIRSSLAAQGGKSPIVRELLCGIREWEEPRNDPPGIPMFLFVGRTDHPAVKGLDLFVRAAGRLVDWWNHEWRHMPDAHEPQFIIRGLPGDEANRLRLMGMLQEQANRAAGGRNVTLIPRAFTTDQSELELDLRRASAVVMPSRAEGFGLVPLEAISHGIPVVVARGSGVADVLKKYCLSVFTTADYIVDTRAADDDAVESLARALALFVQMPVHGELLGQNLRKTLVAYCSWEAAARSLIETVFGRQLFAPLAGAPDPRDEVTDLLRKEKQYVDNECRRICGKSIKDVFVGRDFERWQSLEAYDTSLQTLSASQGADDARKGHSWEDVVQSGPAIFLLGDPGMGKTLCLLREVEQRCEAALSSLEDPSVPLDLVQLAAYFHASEMAVRVVSTGEPALEAVVDLLLIRHGQVSDCAREWMRYALHAGHVLIVVDALDELGMPLDKDHLKDPRALLLERLLAVTRGATPSPVILSSRAAWYITSVSSRAEEWRLLPLKRSQLLSAAKKWMSGHSEVAVAFIRAVTLTPPLGSLLTNPMVLMLACRVCEAAIKRGEELPRIRNRTDLYTHCADYLKARWIERATQKGQPPTRAQQETFLPLVENVAWELFRQGLGRSSFRGSEIVVAINSIPNQVALMGHLDFFETICEAGILTKVAAQTSESPYLFMHRTFLEFFAACHLAHRMGATGAGLDRIEAARPYFSEPRAYEMLWMLAGKLNDPSRLVKAILEWSKFEIALANRVSPVPSSPLSELIVDCLFESSGGTLDVETRDQCWSVIAKGLDRRHRARNQHDTRWTAVADWSLLFRAIRAVDIHDGLLSRADGIVPALEQARRQHDGHTVDSRDACEIDIALQAGVKSPCPVVRWTAIWVAVAVLNDRPNDVRHAFLQQLAEALEHDSNDYVRGIAARALPQLGSPNALTLLKGALKDDNVPVAAAAAIGLSRLATDDAITVLCEAAASLFRSPAGRARDDLLLAVLGGLEWHVGRVVKSKEEPALSKLRTDERLAGIFLRALDEPALIVQGTASSALGKMGWAAAWDQLVELVASKRPSPDTQRLQASILYACDQLADTLDESRLDEAEHLFRLVLRDREQLPTFRRPAVSGTVRLLMRGYRSAALANDLLEAAWDPDATIARRAILGLIQLDPAEIFDDMKLLLNIVRPERRQMACYATTHFPTKTGVLLMQWLLRHDAHPDVLASSLAALGDTYKKMRKGQITWPIEGAQDVEWLAELAPLPYIRFLIRLGLADTAARLNAISPELATQFLDDKFVRANLTDKFLLSSWGTLTARMRPLLTETVIRTLTHSDFAPGQLLHSAKPISVYMRWKEQDLLALSPLVRLLWSSLIDSLTTTYDAAAGKGCQPVLLLIDEAGRTAIPSLADHATTVVGRGISLWIAIQSLSQLETVYGKPRATVLRDNMDSQLFYRPSNQQTADYLEHCLGKKSNYAHSEIMREGVKESLGLSEQGVPLMPSQDIKQLSDEDIIGFHRHLPPLRLKRMDWRRFPILTQRRSIPVPRLSALPRLEDILHDNAWPRGKQLTSSYIDPDMITSDL